MKREGNFENGRIAVMAPSKKDKRQIEKYMMRTENLLKSKGPSEKVIISSETRNLLRTQIDTINPL